MNELRKYLGNEMRYLTLGSFAYLARTSALVLFTLPEKTGFGLFADHACSEVYNCQLAQRYGALVLYHCNVRNVLPVVGPFASVGIFPGPRFD